jgi:geranylgeranyl pyrophosphate synthase
VQPNIPPTRVQREELMQMVKQYVTENKLVPPLPFDDLKVHADGVIEEFGVNPEWRDFAAILVNNESWRDTLATIPFEKRLLLLPVCLRVEHKCPAPFDEFGLLCKKCGLCSIQDLQVEAERLGYPVLIAEGTPIVLKLIETGQIEAVVGVSCLNVLERVFPYMESAAAPGIAIPLLQDDCKDTNVDLQWIWDVIHLTSDDKTYRMDLDAMRREVDEWFSEESLLELTNGDKDDPTESIGREWLARDGKRWRPFLSVCMYKAFQDEPGAEAPEDLKKLAIAVECFHKASLIHDDIEDDDSKRYGDDTVHEQYGIPVALNAGDYLLGEGYRLIAETDAPGDVRSRMLHTAAMGHRSLSLGQGDELIWTRNPKPLKSRQVLKIFRRKTAPAFDVALRIGAIYAGANENVIEAIENYSEALGIAYQIRDDLEDIFGEDSDSNDAQDMRPSLLLALAWERASGADEELMAALWRREVEYDDVRDEVREIITKLKVEDRARNLLDAYQEEAVRSLRPLEHQTVKGLLRRIIGKIFNDLKVETFCKGEHPPGNAASSSVSAESLA